MAPWHGACLFVKYEDERSFYSCLFHSPGAGDAIRALAVCGPAGEQSACFHSLSWGLSRVHSVDLTTFQSGSLLSCPVHRIPLSYGSQAEDRGCQGFRVLLEGLVKLLELKCIYFGVRIILLHYPLVY